MARILVVDSIVLDNRAAVLEATRRLISRGHRKIAYVCNPASVYTQAERLAGYRQAMAEIGVDISHYRSRALRPELVKQADYIFTMTRQQLDTIQMLFPYAAEKTFLLREFEAAVGGD